MFSMRVKLLVVTLLLAFSLACQSAFAQDDPAFKTAAQAYSSYHAGNIDKVDLFSGNLSIDIPLISYPQRGGKLKLGFSLHYQSGPANGDNYCDEEGDCWYQSSNYAHGWEVVLDGVPYQAPVSTYNNASDDSTCDGTNYVCSYTLSVTSPDGAVHQMTPITASNGPVCSYPPCELGSLGGPWRAVDGSGYEEMPNGTIVDGNGIQYVSGILIGNFDWSSSLTNYSYDTPIPQYNPTSPTQIWDTNGNEITATTDPSTGFVGSWTDTLSRPIPNAVPDTPSTMDPNACPSVSGQPAASRSWIWNFPGVNRGTYPIKLCAASIPEDDLIGDYSYDPGYVTELQSVVLPNGTAWTFQYVTTPTMQGQFAEYPGDLSQVNFPAGGSIAYSWLSNGPLICNDYTCLGSIVESRTVSANDGLSPSGTWSYSYTNSGGTPNSRTYYTTVTDPQNNQSYHTFTNLDTNNTDSYYESSVIEYSGSVFSGTPLKSTSTNYVYRTPFDGLGPTGMPYMLYGFAVGVVPSQVTTYWYATGQQSHVTYTYDTEPFYCPMYTNAGTYSGCPAWTGTFGKPVSKYEYDYGAGSPTRTTNISYKFQQNSNYLTINLLNAPYSVQIINSSGGQAAYTYFGYDENNGSPQCVFGNQTSVNKWLNTTGGYLTTKNVYLSNGLVTTTFDPKNNSTGFGYDSCYAGTGPTSITNALAGC